VYLAVGLDETGPGGLRPVPFSSHFSRYQSGIAELRMSVHPRLVPRVEAAGVSLRIVIFASHRHERVPSGMVVISALNVEEDKPQVLV
jgi:hypothetical protein